MASIIKKIPIHARPEAVWSALCDIYNIHNRLARGFVTDTRQDGKDRIVTFANGLVVRERIISLDDAARRIAYSVGDGPLTHHSASFQVFADGEAGTSLLWTTDLLPDEAEQDMRSMIEGGAEAIKRTLEE